MTTISCFVTFRAGGARRSPIAHGRGLQIRLGDARRGVWIVSPVVLTALKGKLKVLPLDVGEAFLFNFAQQWFEVAQAADGLPSGLVDRRHGLTYTAEQEGALDGIEGHARALPDLGKVSSRGHREHGTLVVGAVTSCRRRHGPTRAGSYQARASSTRSKAKGLTAVPMIISLQHMMNR